MNESDKERAFVQKVKNALDDGADRIDPAVRSRLTRMRNDALDQGRMSARGWTRLRWPAMAAAFAAALLVVVVNVNTPDVKYSGPLEDLEILAAEENLEMLQDLDFLAWLAEQEENAS